MKIKQPEPFTFEAGPRAVLLLHGFTGHSADVRMLGRYLEKKGYSSHAPIYRGHGLPPEQLIQSNPHQWWDDASKGYNYLQHLGYREIAVAGLSLGGVLSIKLASSEKVKAVIPMCTPMIFDDKHRLKFAFRHYAKEYKQYEGKKDTVIEEELNKLMTNSEDLFKEIATFNEEVREEVDMVYVPSFIVQARKDEIINPESANYIYEQIESDTKSIKWYEESGHVITLGSEREQLHEDIYAFLESLNWEQ